MSKADKSKEQSPVSRHRTSQLKPKPQAKGNDSVNKKKYIHVNGVQIKKYQTILHEFTHGSYYVRICYF